MEIKNVNVWGYEESIIASGHPTLKPTITKGE